MPILRTALTGLVAAAIVAGTGSLRPTFAARATAPWQALEPGLELGVFLSPTASRFGDSKVRLLRIDPRRFDFRLMNASAPGQGKLLTPRQWCDRNGLVAAINASMYQTDYRTSTSLMKTRTHVNNRRLSRDRAILAFDPLGDRLPRVQIIDRDCQDFDVLGKRYGSLVQSIRMISCEGKNVWKQQDRKWSTSAIGIDRKGRALFIHVRSPYSTHDLIDILLGLPLELRSAMYVEGGPEAQLYVRSGREEFEFIGSFETAFREDDDNHRAWPVPNVIGIARRGRSAAPSRP